MYRTIPVGVPLVCRHSMCKPTRAAVCNCLVGTDKGRFKFLYCILANKNIAWSASDRIGPANHPFSPGSSLTLSVT